MKLSCKTKGNPNTKGKSKIYFCAHPADYAIFLEKFTNDILKTPNCTIWYDMEPYLDWDEEQYRSDLSLMQLFVIPVTKKFLYEQNRAFSRELPFALKHHIPVLPILEDSSLEHAFEEKCGNLQSLKKNPKGPDALPYYDRLKKYLDSVLVPDHLVRQILASFDAEIFLAYRKPDRHFAHQFMQTLHENPRYRNIAVWYDEFLKIGNDYSKEIDAAIQSSSVFAMVMTPNLLEQDSYNYVREREYPLAVSLNKKVVPVEFVRTDHSKAELLYNGIPAWTSIDSKPAFYNSIEAALTGTTLMTPIGRQKNQFLLGLAYLMGIGVERNQEYALSLISSAAEAGLADAMERMVSMYYYGEGVESDISTVIHWQSRLAEYYREAYEATGKREDGIHTIFEQHKLYGYLIESGQENAAGELSVRMKKLSSGLRRKYPRDYSAIECLVISLSDVSDSFDRCGDYENAKKIQRFLFFLNKTLAHDTGLPEANEDLLINYQHLGSISEDCGDYQAALKYYRMSLGISGKMKDSDGSDAFYRRWLDDLYRVGHCYLQLHALGQAEEYLKKSLEGYLSFQNADTELWRIYYALSGLECQRNNLDEALSCCSKSIQSARQESGLEAQRHLSDSYARKADILRGLKQYDDAKQEYLLALDMMQRISDETGAYEDKERVWKTTGMYGDYYLVLNHTDDAKRYYRKALNELNSVSENLRQPQTEIDLAQAHQRMALIAIREENYKQAKAAFKLSIELLKKAKKESADPAIDLMIKIGKKGLRGL